MQSSGIFLTIPEFIIHVLDTTPFGWWIYRTKELIAAAGLSYSYSYTYSLSNIPIAICCLLRHNMKIEDAIARDFGYSLRVFSFDFDEFHQFTMKANWT